MIERHDVLKLMYTYPHNGMRRQDTGGSGHAELWSIMALASLQTGATADFSTCRDIARSLVPDEHGFQLGHIKVRLEGFILAQLAGCEKAPSHPADLAFPAKLKFHRSFLCVGQMWLTADRRCSS